MKLLFLDTETTGVNKNKNGIHQISGAVVIDNIVKEVFDIKFRPFEGCEIDDSALEATHLTKEEILNRELSEQQAYKVFTEIIDKYVNKYNRADKMFMVGYNVHFDKDMVYNWFVRCGDNFLFSRIWGNHIDVMVLATTVLLGQRHLMENFKQGTVAKYLGFKFDEEKLHDALFDIYICIGMYCHLTNTKFEAVETFFTDVSNKIENIQVNEFANTIDVLEAKLLDKIIPIGKHKGKTVGEVFNTRPDYLVWMYENVLNQNIISENLYNKAKQKHQEYLDYRNSKQNSRNSSCDESVLGHILDNYDSFNYDSDW